MSDKPLTTILKLDALIPRGHYKTSTEKHISVKVPAEIQRHTQSLPEWNLIKGLFILKCE